ncbi:hypothetical protein [Gordonia jinhuaensis]|nr:hypothetical protein [Gordonia jinhuaensis]
MIDPRFHLCGGAPASSARRTARAQPPHSAPAGALPAPRHDAQGSRDRADHHPDAEFAAIAAALDARRRMRILAAADEIRDELRIAADGITDPPRRTDDTAHRASILHAIHAAATEILGYAPVCVSGDGAFWLTQLDTAVATLAADTRMWGVPTPRCAAEVAALRAILTRAAVADTGLPLAAACSYPTRANPHGWGDHFDFLLNEPPSTAPRDRTSRCGDSLRCPFEEGPFPAAARPPFADPRPDPDQL